MKQIECFRVLSSKKTRRYHFSREYTEKVLAWFKSLHHQFPRVFCRLIINQIRARSQIGMNSFAYERHPLRYRCWHWYNW